LGSKGLEKSRVTNQGRTIVHVLIRLNHPNKLLDRMIEVESDLVGRRTNRLVASELELSDQILVRILSHSAALVGIQKDIIHIERSSNQRLVVSNGSSN